MKANLLKFIMIIYIFLQNNHIFAAFGDSCAALPTLSSDNYLRNDTAYGHLIAAIDMPFVSGACDIAETQLKFCLKEPTGANPICKTLSLNMGDTITLSSLSSNPELGGNPLLKDIKLTVANLNNYMCLMMPTSRGQAPIICKETLAPATAVNPAPTCSNIGNSCYDGHTKSQSLLNFSGVAIYCLTETIDKVFYTGNTCAPEEGESITMLAPFAAFQEALKTSIRAALILYVMFYGFNLVMSGEFVNLDKIASFVIKFILVVYFSVGIGPIFYQAGQAKTNNGMLDFALPFFKSVTSDMAYMVFNSGGAKGLCEFDIAKYQPGYESFAIWDSIDCRIGYYLGMQLLYNMIDKLESAGADANAQDETAYGSSLDVGPPGDKGIDALKMVGGFPFFIMLFGLLMTGNLIIFAAGLVFAIFFISITLHFISSYLVCLITLYVMTYISPIFIPLALFERTKNYFDSWLKITISCSLQPAVIAGFIALMLTMYDSTIYKNCQFSKHDYSIAGSNFTTFELQLPSVDQEECKSSFGYKMIKYYIGQEWDSYSLIIFPIHVITGTGELLYDFMYLAIFTILFYFFSNSISQFAADVTSGPIMSKVVASPMKIVNMAKDAAKYMQDAQGSGGKSLSKAPPGGDDKKDGEGESKDKIGGGDSDGGGAADKVGGDSGGGGGATDKIGEGGK